MPINPPVRAREFQVLDPCLLGRPVHLLPVFANRLAETLSGAIASPAGRRYWGAWRLAAVSFERAPDERTLRWLGVSGSFGMAAVAFERALLLGLLEGRYSRNAPSVAGRDPHAERVTATEERLAATLAQQLATLVDERVAEGLAAIGADATPVPASGRAAVGPASAPGKAEWVLRVVLRTRHSVPPAAAAEAVIDADLDTAAAAPAPAPTAAPTAAPASQDGQIWIALDHALMAHVLQGLMADKPGARAPRMAAEPLAAHLQVKLEGRLVSKEVTLAALFGLKVGDVIPVSVGRADVLLDDARLFTAAVAEHKGKLCLTSFEDAE